MPLVTVSPSTIVYHSPFLWHSQTNWDWPPKNTPETHRFVDMTMAASDRNPPDRPYRIGPMCMVRRQSSPSPHNYRIPSAHIRTGICSLCRISADMFYQRHHRRPPHTLWFAYLTVSNVESKQWWSDGHQNVQMDFAKIWSQRGFPASLIELANQICFTVQVNMEERQKEKERDIKEIHMISVILRAWIDRSHAN